MRGFEASASRRVSVIEIGRERAPLICVDDFSADPQALVSLACEAVFIDVGSQYPGVRAPAPQGYVDALLAATAPLIEQRFGAPPEADLDLCAFSMVTTPPQRLRPVQRVPHFDGAEPGRIAFLHYLCAPHQGGTSFYRHRATGLETVTPGVVDEFRRVSSLELGHAMPKRDYVSDDTPFYERIHHIDAHFNRLVVYQGNALHSGDISDRTTLSEDPRLGRLTINGFGFLRS